MNIEIELFCNECESELEYSFNYIADYSGYHFDIPPCKYCIEEAKESAEGLS